MAGYPFWGMLRLRLSWPHRLVVLPFCIFFPTERNPILPSWKSSVAIPFFILLGFGSPRHSPLASWQVANSSFFSCWVVWCLWLLLYFLCFFFLFFLFFRAVSIFLWLCLCAWEDSRLLVVAEDPGYFFFNLLTWVSLLLFLGFKPLGPTVSSFSWSPCICFLGLGLFSFGLGSLLWAWALWSLILDLNKPHQWPSSKHIGTTWSAKLP